MTAEVECPKCGGTGFVILERAGVSAAQPCECRAEGRAPRLLDRAQIPALYQNAALDPFDMRGGELKATHGKVVQYVQNFAIAPKPGLLLIGDTGTGKTHLAVAALKRIIAAGHEGVFCDYQNLLDRIRAGYDAASNSADREAYREALEVEVLLLDDLGAHRVTDWVLDTITSIITYRCNNKKPLIATTNLPRTSSTRSSDGRTEYRRTLAEHIGERAYSRLFEMCTVIDMPPVEDYRLRKARAF